MSLAWSIFSLWVFLAVLMSVAWAVVMRTGNSGWVDVIWSFATGAAGAIAALWTVDGHAALPARQMLVAALAAIWCFRLGIHIAQRTIKGGDDPRYAELRKQWGANYRSKLFWFLQIQALAAFLLALCIGLAGHHPAAAFGPGDWLGLGVMIVAIVGEAISDRQLAAFRADPGNKGKICDAGLWGVSRHPNYFFEWLGWCAYGLIAVDPTGTYPWGLLTLAAPVLMYWLLVHVSGIPPLEEHMLRSRGEAFRQYQTRVRAFWPVPFGKN
jgi:steroid 5-alpha reductase family enzyme